MLTSSSLYSFSADVIENNIKKLPFKNIHAQILSIDNKVYQVIVVPVKAPRVIAYTVIGFEFDHSALLQLKNLISLEVSLVKKEHIIESSIEDKDIKQQALLTATQFGTNQQSPNLLLTRSDYYHKNIAFSSSNDIHAILSASLIQIKSDFNQLIMSILIIALVVIIIAFSLSKILSQGLSTPLNILMNVTKNIGKGELEVPKLSSNLPPEFTDLYEGFVLMGSAIENREKEITYQAERDMLTGLFNRYKILSNIDVYLKNNTHLALITFNIKKFKALNDTIGSKNADAILIEIASRINAYIEKLNTLNDHKSIAARINIDEFLICIPINSIDILNDIVKQLQIEIEKTFWIADIKIRLSIYYGIANSIEHGTDAERLIRRSSMAVSNAYKDQVSVRFYQQGDDEIYLYKLHLIEELKAALENPNSPLFMNYQPKLNIKTGKVDKLEALIRWINNKGDFVNPELFINLAEKSGLITTLTRWVILEVIKQVDHWNQLGHKFKVSINLSAQDIQHEQFIEYLLTTLSNFNVEPVQITLELTERDLADNEQLVAERLFYLKSLGFEVSVDDYGIGQSSLAKLKNLPVDELKIDKTFILKLDQCQQDQDIVASTISLGHKLGLRVVAEGVENKASLELLEQFQCDYAQGYYLSRPISAEKFIEWYESDEHVN